jgi:hypothetical protein
MKMSYAKLKILSRPFRVGLAAQGIPMMRMVLRRVLDHYL